MRPAAVEFEETRKQALAEAVPDDREGAQHDRGLEPSPYDRAGSSASAAAKKARYSSSR
jgi:hypothetical protein